MDDEFIQIEVLSGEEIFTIKKNIANLTAEARQGLKNKKTLLIKHYKGNFLVYQFGSHYALYSFFGLNALLVFLIMWRIFKPVNMKNNE